VSITFPIAVDEILSQFVTAWPGAVAIVGSEPEVRWPGNENPKKPDGDKFWARVSITPVTEEQTSLSCSVKDEGNRRYTAAGIVFVQLFCPKSVDNAEIIGQRLSQFTKEIYRGKRTPGGIIFRNVRINKPPAEDAWNRFNVVAEYEYDEVG